MFSWFPSIMRARPRPPAPSEITNAQKPLEYAGPTPSAPPYTPSAPPYTPSAPPYTPSAPSEITNAKINAAILRAIKEEREKRNKPTSLNTVPVIPVTESMLESPINVVLSKVPIQYIHQSATKYRVSMLGGYPVLALDGVVVDGEFSVEDGILQFIDKRTKQPLYTRMYYVYTFLKGGRRRKLRKPCGTRRKLRKTY